MNWLRCAVALPVVLHSQLAAAQDAAALSRLRGEGVAAWTAYEQRVRGLSGRYSVEIMRDGRLEIQTASDVRNYNSYRKVNKEYKLTPNQKLPSALARVSNPLYAFTLERRTPQSDWTISHLAKAPNQSYQDVVRENDDALTVGPRAPVLVRFTPLAELVQQSSFRVTRWSELPPGGDAAYSVAFTCPHPQPKDGPYMPVQSGELQLGADWLAVEYTVKLLQVDEVPVQGQVRYAAAAGGRLPVGFTYRSKFPQPNGRSPQVYVEEATLDLRPSDGPPPANEFRLTAYGMSEPADLADLFPTPWYTRWYVWTLAAALALVAVGRYLVRDRRPHPVGPKP